MAEIIKAFLELCEAMTQVIAWITNTFGVWATLATVILIRRLANQ